MIEYENLRLSNLSFIEMFKQSANEVIDSGWYILGENLKSFEEQFAHYLGTKYCIGVASGLDALKIALEVLEFPTGSEILVPANTFIATIFAILQANLKPVLIEPSLTDYNIDPTAIEKHITANTKAILPVHLYGYPCDMTSIRTIADNYDLKIIEDCAQAHGARHGGQAVGTFGHLNAWSFYPTKNLGALGDAGAITTNDEALAEKARMLRNYGSKIKYHNEIIGHNSRLDEIQAKFLSIKLNFLNKITEHKRQLAKIYDTQLQENFIKPNYAPNTSVYHIYPIRHPERNKLKEYLLSKGVKTEIHYPVAPYNQPPLSGFLNGHYPISDQIHEQILSLPISYGHTLEQIETIVDIMNRYPS